MDPISPVGVFCSAFAVAALAGLAALLRSTNQVTFLNALSSILNGGLMGLGISLLWYTKFQDNIYFLIGICVLAGLGGPATLDFVINAVRKGGLSIKVGDETEKNNAPDKPS